MGTRWANQAEREALATAGRQQQQVAYGQVSRNRSLLNPSRNPSKITLVTRLSLCAVQQFSLLSIYLFPLFFRHSSLFFILRRLIHCAGPESIHQKRFLLPLGKGTPLLPPCPARLNRSSLFSIYIYIYLSAGSTAVMNVSVPSLSPPIQRRRPSSSSSFTSLSFNGPQYNKQLRPKASSSTKWLRSIEINLPLFWLYSHYFQMFLVLDHREFGTSLMPIYQTQVDIIATRVI